MVWKSPIETVERRPTDDTIETGDRAKIEEKGISRVSLYVHRMKLSGTSIRI